MKITPDASPADWGAAAEDVAKADREPSLTAKECDCCSDVPVTHYHVECDFGVRDLCDSCYDEYAGGGD